MCYSVCVNALSPYSPLLLRSILAEMPLALPPLGELAAAFSTELTSPPCCFSRSVSVLETNNKESCIRVTHLKAEKKSPDDHICLSVNEKTNIICYPDVYSWSPEKAFLNSWSSPPSTHTHLLTHMHPLHLQYIPREGVFTVSCGV